MRLARRDERESRENGEKVIRDLVPIIKCLNDLPKGWGKGEKDKEEIRLKDIGSHFHGIGIVGDGKWEEEQQRAAGSWSEWQKRTRKRNGRIALSWRYSSLMDDRAISSGPPNQPRASLLTAATAARSSRGGNRAGLFQQGETGNPKRSPLTLFFFFFWIFSLYIYYTV